MCQLVNAFVSQCKDKLYLLHYQKSEQGYPTGKNMGKEIP